MLYVMNAYESKIISTPVSSHLHSYVQMKSNYLN